jgi:hypothetical protein
MNVLIIDIRENCLRAVLSSDGVLEYCKAFDFEPTPAPDANEPQAEEPSIKHVQAAENPYLLYYDTEDKNSWNTALKKIVKQIYSDVTTSIDSVHLILPSDEVSVETHQLPKMPQADAFKLIGRKISAESKEEYPPFSIIRGTSDQKTQTWCSLYISTDTLRDYHKLFSACRMRLTSITTPVNAMLDAFRSVREAIFNTHAVFEIQRGFIEAFYISADGILHFQRLPYAASSVTSDMSEEDADKAQKQKIFKIINTIFSVNSNYQTAHPTTPVQMAWVCGLESGLDEIASALKEAMGIEVGIAPAMPTGHSDESSYVPLAGFAATIQSNTATTYSQADFFRRFPLRKTSGVIIYTLTACAALLAVTLTEREYKQLKKQVQQSQQQGSNQDKGKSSAAAAYTNNLDALKKLTSRQFVFYNLFRELANGLPDGVFLESLEYRLKDDKGNIDITALAHLDDKISESKPLTRFMSLVDQSPTLKNHREPLITPLFKDNRQFLKIIITSEVNPLDTTK